MFQLGLTLCIEDTKYTIFDNDDIYKIPIGEILADLCNCNASDIIKSIKKCPVNKLTCTKKNVADALLWISKDLTKFFNKSTSQLFTIELANAATDYFNYKTKTKNFFKKQYTENKEFCDTIFKDSGYIEPGDFDVGNILLSFVINIVSAFSIAVTLLNKLTSDKDPELILSIFTRFLDMQHFEYRISIIDGKFTPLYTICTIFSLIAFEVSNIVEKQIDIKSCKNCTKFFIPENRSDTIYCSRISPQDKTKTCKEYGVAQAYKEKLKNHKASGLYRSIYMQKMMLIKRNPDIQEYTNDFENFKNQVKKWKQDIKKNVNHEEAYINWLESVKGKRSE
jgi:hypothetical protein